MESICKNCYWRLKTRDLNNKEFMCCTNRYSLHFTSKIDDNYGCRYFDKEDENE
jgi:hypothetical protein